MHHNSDEETSAYFKSDGFFKQFININQIIDEIWRLRKEEPAELLVWKMKHKQVFKFRSKLLNFLEKRFGRGWAQFLKEKATMDKVKLYPYSGHVCRPATYIADQTDTRDAVPDIVSPESDLDATAGAAGLDNVTEDIVINISVAPDNEDLLELNQAGTSNELGATPKVSSPVLQNSIFTTRTHSSNSILVPSQPLESIASTTRPENEVPFLPSLFGRPSNKNFEKNTYLRSSPSKKRRTEPTNPSRPTTRSRFAPFSASERAEITQAATKDIQGTTAISNRPIAGRIPSFVKNIGPHAETFYFDERRRMINSHIDAIKAEEETYKLQERM